MLRVGARGTRTQGSSFLSSSRFTGVTAAAAARFCPAARSQTLGLVGRYSSSTTTTAVEGGKLTQEEVDNQNKHANVLRLVNAYRTYGHFDAALDPLGRRQRGAPEGVLDAARYGLGNEEVQLRGLFFGLDKEKASVSEIVDALKKTYCSSVGVEFTHVENPEEQTWLARRFEAAMGRTATGATAQNALPAEDKKRILNLLQTSEEFDHFLHTKFRAVKRYGLEGCESMMACMDTIFSKAAESSFDEAVIAMPHRGRLNFLTGILRYPASKIFAKVSGFNDFPTVEGAVRPGTGDVLSHIAQSVDLEYQGKNLHVSLIHNPSHLEAANPVAQGKVRAKQDLGKGRKQALCIVVHGDAAMSAQGVVPETLTLSQLPEYAVGGSMHVVVNNQIGFTTECHKGRSSWYCTDVLRSVHAPAIHVNADDPEAVVIATRLAMDYLTTFRKDIIVDLHGYRRHGHNELDEPSFTQPLMYDSIRVRPTIAKLYGEKLIKEQVVTEEEAKAIKDQARQVLDKEFAESQKAQPTVDTMGGKWQKMTAPQDMTKPVDTGYAEEELVKVGVASINPQGKTVHSRLQNFFCKPRQAKLESKTGLDWATAESLAIGSLLLEKYNVRLSGQDVGRGTFSHRHVALTDQKTNERVIPLNLMSSDQGKLHVADSPLSEMAVMGFEYGYSMEDPSTLVLWEAQFGDFHNGAQIIIDQFLNSGEDKWWRQSALTLLLPHGYDGAGPEHSSCRIERFLQLCDGDRLNPGDISNLVPNMQVINPTTPANYFHALRRQMKRSFRKPMVVVGPKTLLRHPQAVSDLAEMAPGTSFQPVIADTTVSPAQVKRVVMCSGKVYYDLVKHRETKKIDDVAIIRVEELSPFPYRALADELDKYRNADSYRWAQEEPQNAGMWDYVAPRFSRLSAPVKLVSRPASAAPAVGLGSIHAQQQKAILDGAFA